MAQTIVNDSMTQTRRPTEVGVRVPRRFTTPGIDPLEQLRWERRRTVITNPDGTVVFRMDDIEVPEGWSQLATDIIASKYFRKAGLADPPGHETSVRQVVVRLARTIRNSGEEQGGYFASPDDADAFEAELTHMLVNQIGAFNSPVWFNCGLWHEYGIGGSGGNFAVDLRGGDVQVTKDSYSRPQVSACFIQSVDDDLMSIFELARNEARVFKYGSGTGTNFSRLRGCMEKLSGGGTSSGLMSFLEVLDRGAGATKSGGTTRRAAKMVVLDADHPEIMEFIRWKVREERKVAALVGAGYPSDFNGEAYATVSGQNSNNSVRLPDRFMEAVVDDGTWTTTMRTSGDVYETHRARDMWREIAQAAWQCADPGVQFDDTIQRWHTCKGTDRIHATNPCVTGDTLVATAGGWRRIDSLVGSTVDVIGQDGRPHRVTRVLKTGHKPVYRLRTRAGFEVRITGDHKVWTLERGDVPVAELQLGEHVSLKGAGFGSRTIEHGVASAIGMAARQSVANATTDHAGIATLAPEDEFLVGTGSSQEFAPAFFDLNRQSMASLLRELFEVGSGGTQSVSLECDSPKLTQQVQKVLLSFGIKADLQEKGRCLVVDGGLACLNNPQLAPAQVGLTDPIESIESVGMEDVYDLTEPDTHHFVANGLLVHNCSEFVFLDDTACNLASINLMKFAREDGSFDVDGYRHANRVFFLAQEILVSFASYPTEKIARNSHAYRPLGLGYANLGTLLMVQGLPYDSKAARAYAACVTAIMTGEAYALSAEMAASKGAFSGYTANAASMLDVIRLHRESARAIDHKYAPRDIRAAAIECWDRALALGAQFGYRNSQATVLAPTGTIGLLMDCDTTGVEPDFALVKFKKLAGGGYFKIVNQSVPVALRRLGYEEDEIDAIVRYAVGTGSLEGAPHVHRSALLKKGLLAEEIDRIEDALPGLLDVRAGFGRGLVSDEALTRLGVAMAEREKPGFSLLPYFGFTDEQIDEANAWVCGQLTVEGAPGLRAEHLPVFDCANRCGPKGSRFIQPMGHVRMMGAVQPFISGAISKTVNLPQDATVEDVERVYFESWKMGLKAVALYRDGSKLSQPLVTGSTKEKPAPGAAAEEPGVSPPKLRRRRLPKRRHGFTQEARIAGHKVFLRTGEYEDGTLGEIFIDMHKEGAAYRSIMNCFAISVSMGLQYGVPLEDLVDQFTFTRFEPQGRVEGHENLRFCTSVVDYVFRSLGIEYLNRTDLAHIVNEDLQGAIKPANHATGHPVGKEHRRRATDRTEPNGGNGGNGGNGSHDQDAEARAESAAARMRVETGTADPVAGPDAMLAKFPGDAPMCSICGHMTIRNGTCYKCLNCGNSMGCS